MGRIRPHAAPDGNHVRFDHFQLPKTGNLFVRAEVKNVGRSALSPLRAFGYASVNLSIPAPIKDQALSPEMTVNLVTLPGGQRFEATVHVTLDAADAWLVFRTFDGGGYRAPSAS